MLISPIPIQKLIAHSNCLFIFIFIYILMDLFTNLDDIIKAHMGIGMILIYYMAYCPSIIVQITPIAVLISTMYTLGSLAKHNEIIALRASGISVWNTLKPFLIAGLFLSFIILFINDRIAPAATQRFLAIREEKLEGKKEHLASGAKIIKNVAIYGMGNKIIYARIYDPKITTLKDIIIQEQDGRQNVIAKTTAKEAKWTKNGWAAFNITTYRLDSEGQIKEEPKFQHRGSLDIKEGPKDFQGQKYKTEVLNLSELRNYIKRLSGTSGLVLQSLRTEAASRVSYPFANFIAVLIGAAVCLKTKRGSRFLGVGLGLSIGLLFYGVFAVSVALGKGGVLPSFISAWLSNIIFGALGIYLINKY